MPSPNSYILLSLPLRTFDTGDKDEAIQSLAATVSSENGTVTPFPIPSLKIGTLDALVQQADELAKLHSGCEGVVQRVADSLKNILDGDEEKIAQNKMVNDSKDQAAIRSRGGVEMMANSLKNRAYGAVPADVQLEQGQISGGPAPRRAD